jgi:hypothetical protein
MEDFQSKDNMVNENAIEVVIKMYWIWNGPAPGDWELGKIDATYDDDLISREVSLDGQTLLICLP